MAAAVVDVVGAAVAAVAVDAAEVVQPRTLTQPRIRLLLQHLERSKRVTRGSGR